MKNILLQLAIFFPIIFTMCTPVKGVATNPNHAVIKGTVPEKNQMMYIYQNPLNLNGYDEIAFDSAIIDSTGKYSLNVDCSPNSNYSIRMKARFVMSNIYCKNGDTIVLNQSDLESNPEVVYDKGGATKFFANFYKRYPMPPEYFTKMQEGKLLECLAVIDKLKQERSTFLMMNTYILNTYPRLKREMDAILKYEASRDKMNTLMYLYYDENDSITVSDTHCTDFIDKLQFENGNTDLTGAYSSFLTTFLEFPYIHWRFKLMKSKIINRYERLSLRFEFCKSRLNGTSRDYGMFYCFLKLFSGDADSNIFAVAEKQLKDFREFVVDMRYLEIATKLYNTKLALAQGKTAPNFTLPDLTSKNISLSDFKGKTIYMEFTGTWCGPCRKEIPFMKELQKKCKNNPHVQFLTVWLEGATPEMWVKYVQSTGLEGVHIYSSSQFAGEVPKLYQISGVPAFMIIDKNGKVAMPSAKHPSEDGVYEDIIHIAGQ
ncbi:MAG: TlpA family protein disulfide reductase [Bacteroidetes bacterium]|nr:TlpA family protein disulfide reductase [Bacteroidota bacterium]